MNSWRQTMMAGLRPTLGAAKAFATTDFRPDMRNFTVPTLIIHGTSDATVPIDATGRESAKAISGSKLIEYDGSAHGLFATDKERLIGDLLSFLADGARRCRPCAAQIRCASPQAKPRRWDFASRRSASHASSRRLDRALGVRR